MYKCKICRKELVPNKDKVLQLREGYLEGGEYNDFHPQSDLEYYHSSCFIEIVLLLRAKESEEVTNVSQTCLRKVSS